MAAAKRAERESPVIAFEDKALMTRPANFVLLCLEIVKQLLTRDPYVLRERDREYAWGHFPTRLHDG